MTNPNVNPLTEITGGSAFTSDHALTFVDTLDFNGISLPVGTSFVRTVPPTELWEITYFHITLSTSAVAGTRYPFIRIDDAQGNDVMIIANQFPAQWTASKTERVAWQLGRNRDTGTNAPMKTWFTNMSHLPRKTLVDPGGTFTVAVANMDANDVMGDWRFRYRKYSANAQKLALI